MAALLAQARAEAAQDCAPPGRPAGRHPVRRAHRGRRARRLSGVRHRPRRRRRAASSPTSPARSPPGSGSRPVFRRVTSANRIAALGEGGVDLVIATMGHTSQRDGEIRFIRPHYFQSRTVLVGPHGAARRRLDDLAGATVCVTRGQQHQRGADRARRAADAVRRAARPGECAAARHLQPGGAGRQFLRRRARRPGFAARFAVKFSFAPLPWGMAVPRSGADRLATLLDLLSLEFHRDGVFLGLAARNGAPLAFLQAQQAAWRSAACVARRRRARRRPAWPSRSTARCRRRASPPPSRPPSAGCRPRSACASTLPMLNTTAALAAVPRRAGELAGAGGRRAGRHLRPDAGDRGGADRAQPGAAPAGARC